jgi:hypothetical protein
MRTILVSAVFVVALVENVPTSEILLALWASEPCFAVMGRKRFIDCSFLHPSITSRTGINRYIIKTSQVKK